MLRRVPCYSACRRRRSHGPVSRVARPTRRRARRPAPATRTLRTGRARSSCACSRRRVLPLPDVSQLRLATTACSGGASCCTCEPLSFEGYRAPTEHPLAIAVRRAAVAASATAPTACWSRSWSRASSRSSSGSTGSGGRRFTPLVGVVAAVLLVTRFDFPFLAARGYIDIPYLALVVWAAVLEAARAAPRAGPCSCCSRSAALLRPEAWLLAGLYCALGALARDLARSASATRRSPRSGRVVWVVHRLRRHRRPAVLAAPTRATSPRSSGRNKGARRGARGDCASSSSTSSSSPVVLGGASPASSLALCARAAARCACRSCCSSSGVGDVRRWSASPACR